MARLPISRPASDNYMAHLEHNSLASRNLKSNLEETASPDVEGPFPFHAGSIVIATLGNPREKFWGAILSLAPEGLSIRGIELASFEDLVSLIREKEPYSLNVIFFPMHRIERIELDQPDGNIPSLAQRFSGKTGLDAATILNSGTENQAAGKGPTS